MVLILWEKPIGTPHIKEDHPLSSQHGHFSVLLFSILHLEPFCVLHCLPLHSPLQRPQACTNYCSSCTCCISEPASITTVAAEPAFISTTAAAFFTVVVMFLHQSRGLFQNPGYTNLICQVHLIRDSTGCWILEVSHWFLVHQTRLWEGWVYFKDSALSHVSRQY